MKYSIEQLTLDDMDLIINLSTSVGWDYTSKEVKVFLESGTLFGHREGHSLVSCAGIFSYGDLASIGAVMVHPEYQGQGLGRVLMNHCLYGLEDDPIMLVSTEEGKKLYRSLGFKTVSHIHKLVSERPIRLSNPPAPTEEINPMTAADLDDVIQLDAAVSGANRTQFLKGRFPFLNAGVTFRSHDGIQGYAMTVCRHDLLIVGPVVAPSLEISVAMVDFLIDGWQGRMRIDVPSSQKEFFETLVLQGFQEVERPPVMMRNATKLPGKRNRLYAIAAQALG